MWWELKNANQQWFAFLFDRKKVFV